MTKADIDLLFDHHDLTPLRVEKCEAIAHEAKRLAAMIVSLTPAGADQDAAIRKLKECVMTANAAIAMEGL